MSLLSEMNVVAFVHGTSGFPGPPDLRPIEQWIFIA